MMEFKHVPVLLSECIEGLNIRPDGVYADGTLGGGGHSSVIFSHLKGGKLIGIDRDAEIVIVAEDAEMVGAMARWIGDMRLNISVWMTEDLKCLPEPVLSEVPSAPKSLLQRIKSKLEERQN